MHIMEGYLPMEWCAIWFALSLIAIIIGVIQLKRIIPESPEVKKLFAINGVIIFLESFFFNFHALNGTSSHPSSNAVSGSLLGPAITSVIVAVVLLLQAFLLGYGGLTTLGANIFSIGVVGPLGACIVYNKTKNISDIMALVLAVLFANFSTILTTALQYAVVYGSFYKFFVILFATQILMIPIDVIVSLIVFVILKANFEGSRIFSFDLNDFFKLN